VHGWMNGGDGFDVDEWIDGDDDDEGEYGDDGDDESHKNGMVERIHVLS
jgi:hypothetical protein